MQLPTPMFLTMACRTYTKGNGKSPLIFWTKHLVNCLMRMNLFTSKRAWFCLEISLKFFFSRSVKVISIKGEYISGLEFNYLVELTHGSKHTRNCTVNIMENNSHIVIKCEGSKTEVDQTVKFTWYLSILVLVTPIFCKWICSDGAYLSWN